MQKIFLNIIFDAKNPNKKYFGAKKPDAKNLMQKNLHQEI